LSSVPPVSRPPEAEPRPREPIFRIPPVTGWLIGINILVQAILSVLPIRIDDLALDGLGFSPGRLDGPFDSMAILTLLTYQFLHGGWQHLGINMVSLLAFGSGVERPLGRGRYLIVYFLSGIAGALLEAAFAAPDAVLVGASASISGVFGALLIVRGLYRTDRRFGILPMAVLWIVLMSVTGIAGVGAGGMQVAWIAHIGGFVAGLILASLLRPKPA
jgi:membrane associated rhomboid family serine protease